MPRLETLTNTRKVVCGASGDFLAPNTMDYKMNLAENVLNERRTVCESSREVALSY